MAKLEEWEINKYWEIFNGLHPINGFLNGEQAASVLKNSQLSDVQLEKIWDLADIDSDGNLDFEEFCVAMRLIFDMINGVYKSVPKQIPSWLVPSSKVHLITANNALSSDNNNFSINSINNNISNDDSESDDEYSGKGLRDDFDWYISPSDKKNYESIYNANVGRHGQISFDSLTELYDTLNLPDTDVRSSWNLVNPKSDETIGHDQTMVFLHILNNRSKGFRVPRSVPPSLRSTFENNKPNYSLDQSSSNDKYSRNKNTTSDTNNSLKSSKNSSFGSSYLNRLGLRSSSGDIKRDDDLKGTDFSSTKNTDWEEVRLKRELANLQNQLDSAQKAKEKRAKDLLNKSASSNSALVRRELSQMYDYKQKTLLDLKQGRFSSSSSSKINSNTTQLQSAKEEIEMIKSQLDQLEEFAKLRKQALHGIRKEIDNEKGH